MTEAKRITDEELDRMDRIAAGFGVTPKIWVRRLIAEVRYLNIRIADMMLGCEVDDVYPGQEEAQTINQFEKL